MKRICQATLLAILLSSCDSPKQKFSEDEKRQARLFIEAIKLDNESVKISNLHNPYEQITGEDIKKMLDLKKEALSKAEMIPDKVLEKMNKDLPEQYTKYKKGVSLRIENFRTGNIETEKEGSRLIDEWIDWYSQNVEDI